MLHISWLLQQSLWIPLAPRHIKEIAPVDVNGARQAPDGIGHGVDNVAAERQSVALPDGLGAGCLDLTARSVRQPPPQDVVLAARVDPDDGPHVVIVRHHGHARAPYHVEDREIGTPRLAKGPQNVSGRIGPAGHDFPDGRLTPYSRRRRAFASERVQVEHGLPPFVRYSWTLSGRATNHTTRQRARMIAAVDRHLPVHQHGGDAGRVAARLLVGGAVGDARGVEDHYVGPRAGIEDAAIAQPERTGRHARHLGYRRLERE